MKILSKLKETDVIRFTEIVGPLYFTTRSIFRLTHLTLDFSLILTCYSLNKEINWEITEYNNHVSYISYISFSSITLTILSERPLTNSKLGMQLLYPMKRIYSQSIISYIGITQLSILKSYLRKNVYIRPKCYENVICNIVIEGILI